MNHPLYILILAAGQGKRMRSTQPKVLMPLAGRTLIEHVLQTARALSPMGICIVRAPHDHALVDTVSKTYSDIQWVIQETATGTAGAVEAGLAAIPSHTRVLILYGDVPLLQTTTLNNMLSIPTCDLVILTGIHPQPYGYGRIVRDKKGNIIRIQEDRDCDATQRLIQEINLGVYVCPVEALQRWLPLIQQQPEQERYLTDMVAYAVAEKAQINHVTITPVEEALGANTKKELAQRERYYQQRLAHQLLEQGVHLYDPQRIDIRGHLSCGHDVSIDINCVFIGDVRLDDHVHIGPHCVITDSHIGAGTHIHAFTHIDHSHIGTKGRIGPYARLRVGTHIDDHVSIGNFVETKKTHIQSHSKAGHLSYLGDCHIGQRVNIGAGTITCNFDGHHKHLTTIHDDAFIGSGTELVAPVSIGQGATIAAGTTVTKKAPDHALTVRRAPQKSIAGWSRDRFSLRKKKS